MDPVKTSDKYRFTLQWGAETAEKVQAGELLENLGNRKSEFVVMAVSEYIEAHPESLSPGQKPKVVVRQNLTRNQIEEIVVSILEKRMGIVPEIQHERRHTDEAPADIMSAVEEMLNNVALFS